MAFNFRPNSVKEISDKKRIHSAAVGDIYSYILNTYNSGIILDPTTQFQTIKIPREVEKGGIKIATIKQNLKTKKIWKDGLVIQFGNGSGAGGSKIDAKTTAMQENATRFVCEQVIEKGKFPLGSEISKIYPDYDDEWNETFKMQADALKLWGIGRGYEYSRDELGGIMTTVEDIAINKCKCGPKDSWNPADIYVVKKIHKARIVKELKAIGELKVELPARLDRLNEYMRGEFQKKNLVGISLKKLGKTVRTEETNIKRLETIKGIEIIEKSIKLNLDLDPATDEFNTGEMSLQLDVHGNQVAVQIRNFDVSKPRGRVQMDMTEAGAVAKLGKVSSTQAIDPYLLKYNLHRREMNTIPRVGEWHETNIRDMITEFKDIQNTRISGQTINYGVNDWETTLRQAIEIEKGNNKTASQLSSKLQCFQWVRIFRTMELKRKLDEFLTVLYLGAKKQYDTAGPFLKIY